MRSRHKAIDFTRVETTTLRKRACRLHVDMLASLPDPVESLQEFFRALPRVGASNELIGAADALAQAALNDRTIVALVDADVIEAGLSPLLIRMVQRGLIRAVAMTGSAAVRDYELAVYGRTSEDISAGLRDGLLGMSRETGEGMNAIINEGVKRGFGLGECLGRGILDRQPPFYRQSIMASCSARMVACSIHVNVGVDGFHRHPTADGSALGKGSLKDLQILSSRVESLGDGGLILAMNRSRALSDIVINAYAAGRNEGTAIEDFSLIRFTDDLEPLRQLPGMTELYHLPGPLELLGPLFAGVLFSLVE